MMDRQGESLTLRIFNNREKNMDSRKFYDVVGCICFLLRKRRENKDVDQEIELERPFIFSDDSALPETSENGRFSRYRFTCRCGGKEVRIPNLKPAHSLIVNRIKKRSGQHKSGSSPCHGVAAVPFCC